MSPCLLSRVLFAWEAASCTKACPVERRAWKDSLGAVLGTKRKEFETVLKLETRAPIHSLPALIASHFLIFRLPGHAVCYVSSIIIFSFFLCRLCEDNAFILLFTLISPFIIAPRTLPVGISRVYKPAHLMASACTLLFSAPLLCVLALALFLLRQLSPLLSWRPFVSARSSVPSLWTALSYYPRNVKSSYAYLNRSHECVFVFPFNLPELERLIRTA